MTTRCPRCGSSQIRGAKFGFAASSLREFGCLNCGLIEDRRTDAPDYAEWLARWKSEGAPSAAPGPAAAEDD
ncbi:MAG TPA: hypothetical protein VGD80_34690 [Kofleriaceae bacterium]